MPENRERTKDHCDIMLLLRQKRTHKCYCSRCVATKACLCPALSAQKLKETECLAPQPLLRQIPRAYLVGPLPLFLLLINLSNHPVCIFSCCEPLETKLHLFLGSWWAGKLPADLSPVVPVHPQHL